MGLLSNISEYFASNTYVQATENSISTNELENSIDNLNGRYNSDILKLVTTLSLELTMTFQLSLRRCYVSLLCIVVS